ncbi:---NA--- : ATPase involved in chromosome partitioning OS=Sphaerochaeta pleomorpha (strain ATCC BAA-1885 / DSM 22778 / Grapes) GN=SpiGrapes_2247 PE=4 SV=1: Wzz [Gemmataceae bacterium]|nr:---NA--- : ATPase involved in chromosome partitioning OS=Sphaerochaeta pleomorpha (strain ATCC BAA-1885 / DSM 22778 / Grapes) GN=SpiGrapes_2247 PE=4 SV=1: Wzz [Gemmataceae bacterium]VTU01967.1 ---NA--- : ATPase involved in chromosome partitioning OS=Sphaerochaeta pleomorpha (strain ATCC BAA-1885 / DSM 22778 / Grapes) GN=SpiGrapes_2247 PE=4 SV=1: Wzz [Gemmataceae bacterium]
MPTPADPRTAPPADPVLVPEYLWAPLRRWKLTLLCVAASALAAGAAAARFSQHLWPVETTIVYTPLALGGHGDYTPPSPQTLISLVKSQQRLEKVARELDLPVPARTLDRAVKVTQQPNVDAVRLSIDWPDPDAGRAIVDRVADEYIRDTAAMRRDQIQQALAMLRSEQAGHARALAEARAAYEALPERVTHARLAVERERGAAAATTMTTDLNLTLEKLAAARTQLDRAREMEAAAAAGTPAAEDAGYRERKQALVDALRACQAKLQEIDVETESRKKELAGLQRLVDTGVGSRAELSRVVADIALLGTRRTSEAAAAAEHTRELAELPLRHARRLVAQHGAELAGLELRAAALRRGLDQNRADMVRTGELSAAEEAARRKLDHAEADARGVAARVAALERLRDGPAAEFAVVHPAAVTGPPASNKKVIGVFVFAGLVGLSLLGIVGRAWFARPPGGAHPATYGLPVLAAAPGDAPGRTAAHASTEARRLALQLREPVRNSGGVILCVAADAGTRTDDVAWQLARYLALAGEGVLILDTRVTDVPGRALGPAAWDSSTSLGRAGDQAGLSQCFRNRGSDATALVTKTDATGVAYLPAGRPFPDPDQLASAFMQGLLVRFAERYDRVVLLGDPLENSLSAEILAGYADGALVVCRRDGAETPEGRAAVAAIRAAGTPWVGAVVRSAGAGEGGELPFAVELSTADDACALGAGEEPAGEESGVLRVTRGQAAGLRADAPGPFQAQPLDQTRGAAHAADQHVEGRPDLKAHRRA